MTPPDNTVCKACGGPNERIGLNQDNLCDICRSYEQALIRKRAQQDEQEQSLKRAAYFAHLE